MAISLSGTFIATSAASTTCVVTGVNAAVSDIAVAFCYFQVDAPGVSSITDSGGNTWVFRESAGTPGGNIRVEIWTAVIGTALSSGSITVTQFLTVSARVIVSICQGAANPVAIDAKNNGGNASSTTSQAAPVTTTDPGDIILNGMTYNSSNVFSTGPGGSWTTTSQGSPASNFYVTQSYLFPGTTGTYTPTYTFPGSYANCMVTIALKPGVVIGYPWLRTPNSSDPVLAQNLLTDFRFTGNLVDSSSEANDGTAVGSLTATTDRRGSSSSAYTFDGTTNYVYGNNSFNNILTFTLNVWFKTTTSAGGVLTGFASSALGTSPTNNDRFIWMDTTGKMHFGIWTGAATGIASSASYNDGSWHMVTATLSPSTGMNLYVDGSNVANDASTTAQSYVGYLRVGYGRTTGWPAGTGTYFAGDIDEVKLYGVALSGSQITELATL